MGSRNSTFSCWPGMTFTSTGPNRFKTSITSSTRNLRRGRARGDPHSPDTSNPRRVEFLAICDEITRNPLLGSDLPKPVRIGAVSRPDDQQNIHEFRKVSYRRLTILCRIADILGIWA